QPSSGAAMLATEIDNPKMVATHIFEPHNFLRLPLPSLCRVIPFEGTNITFDRPMEWYLVFAHPPYCVQLSESVFSSRLHYFSASRPNISNPPSSVEASY